MEKEFTIQVTEEDLSQFIPFAERSPRHRRDIRI